MEKLIITELKNNKMRIELKTQREPSGLRGHKFVGLMGASVYQNDFTLLLDFFNYRTVKPNKFMEMGQLMENHILDYVWGENNYYGYDYDEHKDLFQWKNYGGLIDGLSLDKTKIAEVKTYYSKRNFIEQNKKQAYIYQAQLYMWLLSKCRPHWKIESADIMMLYIPFKDMLRKRTWIIKENLNVINVKYEPKEVSKWIKKALRRRKRIVESKKVIVDINELNIKTIKELKQDNKLEVEFIKLKGGN